MTGDNNMTRRDHMPWLGAGGGLTTTGEHDITQREAAGKAQGALGGTGCFGRHRALWEAQGAHQDVDHWLRNCC